MRFFFCGCLNCLIEKCYAVGLFARILRHCQDITSPFSSQPKYLARNIRVLLCISWWPYWDYSDSYKPQSRCVTILYIVKETHFKLRICIWIQLSMNHTQNMRKIQEHIFTHFIYAKLCLHLISMLWFI